MNHRLLDLARILAGIFPDEASSVRIIDDAGINRTRIHAEQSAGNRWYYIVQEAAKAGMTVMLIDTVLFEYPNRTELLAIRADLIEEGHVPSSQLSKGSQRISVLMVAPRSNLPLVDAETQDVLRSGLEVTPVFSPVGQTTLTREIRSGGYDGLWLAGHMDKDGNFLLDNGELLSSSALTSLVRGRFRWVYLNTCQSVGAAQMLQNETDADIICTIVEVPDTEAYRTGSLFANALARSGDTREAYEQSRPGNNRAYLFLSASRKK